MIASRWIYLAGIRLRNHRIVSNLRFLLESQNWTLDHLQNHQLTQLKHLVEWAHNKSPYYGEKFKKAGFDSRSILNLGDISRIPITTKDELLHHRDRIQIHKMDEPTYYSETSGSSGTPLVFYRNQNWDAWHNASVMRGLSWHGVCPWERNGYLWGYNLSFTKRAKVKFFDRLQNRFRLFSYGNAEMDEFLSKLKNAVYLSGYSSMIFELAKRVNSYENKPVFRLKLVKGTSETISEAYQSEVASAFGQRMVSEYGAAEAGIIAFECPEHRLHINMETVLVEELGGEILVTNLVSYSFPIIRYKLGDYIELEHASKCLCGKNHLLIKSVLGRVGKTILGNKGNYPSLMLYYVFKNLASEKKLILNYQAEQDVAGHLILRIETKLAPTAETALKQELHKYFGTDLDCEIRDQTSLRSCGRKKVDFISMVN
jgi:phenylacetate-CoA ligase